jgi:hypothetical protein
LLGNSGFIQHLFGIYNGLLGWFQHGVESAQNAHWQDNIGVLSSSEQITQNIIYNVSDERNNLIWVA